MHSTAQGGFSRVQKGRAGWVQPGTDGTRGYCRIQARQRALATCSRLNPPCASRLYPADPARAHPRGARCIRPRGAHTGSPASAGRQAPRWRSPAAARVATRGASRAPRRGGRQPSAAEGASVTHRPRSPRPRPPSALSEAPRRARPGRGQRAGYCMEQPELTKVDHRAGVHPWHDTPPTDNRKTNALVHVRHPPSRGVGLGGPFRGTV
jgi:hypothetical protein